MRGWWWIVAVLLATPTTEACPVPLGDEIPNTCIVIPTRLDCTEFVHEQRGLHFRWDEAEPFSFRLQCENERNPVQSVEFQIDQLPSITVTAPTTRTQCLGRTIFTTRLLFQRDHAERYLRVLRVRFAAAVLDYTGETAPSPNAEVSSVRVSSYECPVGQNCGTNALPAHEPLVMRWSSGGRARERERISPPELHTSAPPPRVVSGGCAGCHRTTTHASSGWLGLLALLLQRKRRSTV